MGAPMNDAQSWHLSDRAAERYERFVVRYILGPWSPVLVEAARLEAGERVLDVACGTGVVARAAAARVGPTGDVIGADLNPGMIAVARALPAGTGAPIEWLVRDALELGLDAASRDVVLCQQGLQFFPDQLRALRGMRRVLVRGGRLAVSVWSGTGLYNGAVGDALAGVLGDAVARRFLASRRAPTAETLMALVREAGFRDAALAVKRLSARLPRVDAFALDHLSATPVAADVAAADPAARAEIGAFVARRLQPYAVADGIIYPEESFLVTARTT
jgi:SAM-dependent methyltransferase